jgi:hypothetical protein
MEYLQAKYLTAAASYRLLASKEAKKLLLLSILRLLTFTGGLILIVFAFSFSKYAGVIALAIVICTFLFLLKSYSVHSGKKEHFSNLGLINENEASALDGDYSMFDDGSRFAATGHDFVYDLDIFGPSSLYQYLNRTCTGYGSEVLAGWLSDPYPIEGSMEERQKAISEIAAKDSWRQSFIATGMNKSLTRENISGISKWLERESSGSKSTFIKTIIWVLPALCILSAGLAAAGILHYSFFTGIFLVNTFIILFNLKKSSSIHEELTGRFRYLSSVGRLLEVLENESFESPVINRMKHGTPGKSQSSTESMNELGRIIRAFDSRLNVIAGFILNGFLLWDLHCIRRLDRWKNEHREQFPVWLKNLGETDALISLGNYSFNNPGFVFPVKADEGIIIDATALGHQLIHSESRVTNDFRLSGKGRICIITGANMAGKSTFLRSVAVNLILAMTGAPVCALVMKFSPVRLFTSMRTTDSLSSNESYFYAELKRLKILEQKIKAGENTFFILDEILKGTNSDDKSQGSRLFMGRIISLGGTGLIATHDTSLGTMQEEFPAIIENKCVEVDIDGDKISFDYKLREGIASKKNAVLLMKQMGIIDS